MKWPKGELAREVARLRAILREHAERPGSDPREASTTDSQIDIAGDPYATGGALLDARSAVLMENVAVVLVDTKRDEAVSMMLTLEGRINYAADRAEHAYLFGPDGAAALVSELVALAGRAASHDRPHGRRFADEFRRDLDRRMNEMP
jgi:hypothetical protein